MTMLPWRKICPICGREYSFNPDVGKIFCPRCQKKLGKEPEIALRIPAELSPKNLKEIENESADQYHTERT